jgi:hypothetical protein
MAGNELGAIDAPPPNAEAAVELRAPNLEHKPGMQAISNLQASMNGYSAEGSASKPGSLETGTFEASITGRFPS